MIFFEQESIARNMYLKVYFVYGNENNYKKEIIISQNKRYILRLRDGKTYVKFSYDMSTNSSNQLYASFYLLSFNKPSESESKPSNNVSAPNTQ